DLDHGIHALAALEAVLELVRIGRQAIAKEVAEQQLSEAASCLRRPQDLLELRELLGVLGQRRRGAADVAELLVNRVRLLRRVLEPAVDLLVEEAETAVHRLGDPLQAPLDVGVAGVESGLRLRAEAIERLRQPDGEHAEGGQQDESDDDRKHGPRTLARPSDSTAQKRRAAEAALSHMLSRSVWCSAARSRSCCAICSALSARSSAIPCCSWCMPSARIVLSPMASPA